MSLAQLEQMSVQQYSFDVEDQLKQHVYRRATEAIRRGETQRDAIQTVEQLQSHQQTLRERFIASLGGLPESTPLNARVVGEVKGDGYRVEKVMFEARPGDVVTANLYLPDGLSAPSAAVQFVCGHHKQAKHQPEYQRVCMTLCKAGLIVLAQDPIGQGERLTLFHPNADPDSVVQGTREHDSIGTRCLPLGQTLGRYFLHDAMRGIDYLCDRPEVDNDRIGITGNSGGGTQSSLMMLADPRLAAAAPATFIMNRETYMWTGQAQDAEQVWPGFTAMGYDHKDILLAMCPRPVRVLAVTWDFFPIEGTRQTVQRCQRLWDLCGAGDKLDLIEDDSVHQYTPALADSAASFFARELLGKEVEPCAEQLETRDPSELWCTRTGQLRGDDLNARTVHDTLCKAADAIEGQAPATAAAWLKDKVYANRQPGDLNPRYVATQCLPDLAVDLLWWWSQRDLVNTAQLYRPIDTDRDGPARPVTIAVWPGGTNTLTPHLERLRTLVGEGRTVMVLDTTAHGSIKPRPLNAQNPEHFYGVLHKLCCDLQFIDDSLLALRAYDIVRAMDFAAQWPALDASDLAIEAYGYLAAPAIVAAAVDERVGRLTLPDGAPSLRQIARSTYYTEARSFEIMVKDMLHHTDLPGLAEWVNQR